jgi:hypothetical protein
MTLSGLEPVTFRLVAKRLNHLWYRVPLKAHKDNSTVTNFRHFCNLLFSRNVATYCWELEQTECYGLIKTLISSCSGHDSLACHNAVHFC